MGYMSARCGAEVEALFRMHTDSLRPLLSTDPGSRFDCFDAPAISSCIQPSIHVIRSGIAGMAPLISLRQQIG